MSRTRLIFVAIVVVYVAIVCGVIAHWNLNPRSSFPKYLLYKASEISKSRAQQEGYFVLENPDDYVLEAINNLGEEVWVDQTETTFLEQAAEHGYLHNIEYEGKYYHIGVICADPKI